MNAMKNRIVAFVAGVLLGPAIVWAGLETGTYISDLVAANPLSSDLASTADDHIRLLKSTIKTTFPNINNAVTVTDEQLNAVGASGVTGAANPTANVGLSAVNGSATTYMRSDGAPALSQAIAPTWTASHQFTRVATNALDGALFLNSSLPLIGIMETGVTADNGGWNLIADAEQLALRTNNDSGTGSVNIMSVDRTGTTVDRVAFPTQASGGFSVGSLPGILNSSRMVVGSTSNTSALQIENNGNASGTLLINNADTSGDNFFIRFATESSGTGTERGSIKYNRAGGVVAYNTSSDARLKKNFKPAPTARKLIHCIPIESYDWKDSGNHVVHGLVAQRLNKCAPYAVTQGDVWQIDPSKLVPALIKYVQEQDDRIERLEAQMKRMR